MEINLSAWQRYLNEIPDKALELGGRVVLALVVFLIGMQFIRLIRTVIKKALRRSHAEKGLVQFLDSFIKTTLYLVLIAMILRGFGLDATSVAALIGTVGVAIGLAVQGSLSNLAGGVLIILLKPFKVGDYIKEDRFGNEGTVNEIDLIYTKLLTLDNREIILPNGTLANASMTNVTANPIRRLDISVTVSVETDVLKAKTLLTEVLEAEQAIIKEKDYFAYVNELIYGGVVLGIRCWVNSADLFKTKCSLNENIKIAFDKAGIVLARRKPLAIDDK
ncbi:MAG: mechanosensitive ion channel family protein [Lachnospiraceae bacterium]|nr:mechanosensitive ion channel family protein [Lachnospiraceae bacterium]